MRVILARAACRYSGRIDAELTLGDVCIVLREPALGGDGSCLVLGPDRGVGPRNWMPAGSQITARSGGWIIEHPGRGEILEIFVDEVHSEQIQTVGIVGELKKLGAEREFSDLIADHVHCLGIDDHGQPLLDVVSREFRTTAGPVDLLCRDHATGQLVAVEVKRQKIMQSDTWQLRRYLAALADLEDCRDLPPRGLLVAPVLTKNARTALADVPDVQFVRLSYQDLIDA